MMIKEVIINVENGSQTERFLEGKELEIYLKDKAEDDAKQAELMAIEAERFNAKIAIAEKLGLSVDELKTLLG